MDLSNYSFEELYELDKKIKEAREILHEKTQKTMDDIPLDEFKSMVDEIIKLEEGEVITINIDAPVRISCYPISIALHGIQQSSVYVEFDMFADPEDMAAFNPSQNIDLESVTLAKNKVLERAINLKKDIEELAQKYGVAKLDIIKRIKKIREDKRGMVI